MTIHMSLESVRGEYKVNNTLSASDLVSSIYESEYFCRKRSTWSDFRY